MNMVRYSLNEQLRGVVCSVPHSGFIRWCKSIPGRSGEFVFCSVCITLMGCTIQNDREDVDLDGDSFSQGRMDSRPDPDTGLTKKRNEGMATRTSPRHLSEGRPVYASGGDPSKCNDGAYGVDYWGVGTGKDNTWTAASPAWCAMDLGDTSAKEVMVVLSDESGTGNIEGHPGFRRYTIETSANSTDGENGSWNEQISVKKNVFGYRMHRLAFTAQRWVKVTVLAPATAVLDELDVWDVSDAPDDMPDSIIWVGDSITARCSDRHGTFGAKPSLQQFIHHATATRYPLQMGAGTVNISTSEMLNGNPSQIDTLLAVYPDIHIWGLALGTNDSAGHIQSDEFESNLTALIDKIEAAGHLAVPARIPCPASHIHSRVIARLNAVIDHITEKRNLVPGPDLYNLFNTHAGIYYDRDSIHPNSVGCTAWQLAWANILLAE